MEYTKYNGLELKKIRSEGTHQKLNYYDYNWGGKNEVITALKSGLITILLSLLVQKY